MSEFIEAAGEIVGGIQDFKAAKREKKDIKKQTGLMQREEELEAARQEKIDEITNQHVTQSFLKSGVRLEGTPLTVLAEREQESANFISSMRASTTARATFARDKGKRVLTQGRNRLVASGFKAGAKSTQGIERMVTA